MRNRENPGLEGIRWLDLTRAILFYDEAASEDENSSINST